MHTEVYGSQALADVVTGEVAVLVAMMPLSRRSGSTREVSAVRKPSLMHAASVVLMVLAKVWTEEE